MVFLTGDTHGEFGRIEEFCAECGTSTDDVMVILGDAGINFYRDKRDDELKEYLSELPVTLLCVQGNHEERPDEILGYEEMEWHGGIVLFQPDYPNILFAWDGEVYDFDGKKAIAVGGVRRFNHPADLYDNGYVLQKRQRERPHCQTPNGRSPLHKTRSCT